jgi:MacB-like periplasmic core domain
VFSSEQKKAATDKAHRIQLCLAVDSLRFENGQLHAIRFLMLKDLKFAFRQLRRSRGFAATAVLTLALGIGANTAIFSLVDSILLRPLPFPRQNRLVRMEYSNGEASFFPKGWVQALGEHSRSFRQISGFGPDEESNVSAGDSSDRVFGAKVMANAFETLGIHPAVGTFFTPDDGVSGRDQVVILSYG